MDNEGDSITISLRELNDALAPLGIDWAGAGAIAANNYRDQVRVTTDLDVMMTRADHSVDVVCEALRENGWDQINVVEDWLIRAEHPTGGRLDVLVAGTEYETGAIARAQSVAIDEQRTCDLLPSLKSGASSFTGSCWGLPQSNASLHWQKRLARPSLFSNFNNSKEHVATQRT